MNETSRWLLANSSDPLSYRDSSLLVALVRQIVFALAYSIAVIGSYSLVYADSLVAIVWPSVGIAVWWAVTCRSWKNFALICGYVFLVPAIYLHFFTETSIRGVILAGIAHAIAGPGVALVMAFMENAQLPEPLRKRHAFAPFSHLRLSVDVFRLLVAGIVMVAISKLIVIFAYALADLPYSFTLYLTMALRDLTGIIVVAGPGIALSTPLVPNIHRSAWREFAVVFIATIGLLALIFGFAVDLPTVYLAMLPLYWSATRLPVPLAVLHAVITSAIVVVLYFLLGTGPFAITDDSILVQATTIQLFVLMCILLSLVVSTTVQQTSALVEELEVVAKTLPDALFIVNKNGTAFPVNAGAKNFAKQSPDGHYFMPKLQNIDGEPIDEKERPSSLALRGQSVEGVLAKLGEVPGEDPALARRIFKISASPMYLRGETEPGHALVIWHDSTNQYYTMQQLTLAYEESRLLFENAPQGIAMLEPSGEIVMANRSFGDLVGTTPVRLLGRNLEDFGVEEGTMEYVTTVLLDPEAVVHLDRSLETLRGKQKNVAMSFSSMGNVGGRIGTLLVNVVDVTERQELIELVEHLADHDSLTGLVNRRRLESNIEELILKNERESTESALLLLDLDYFKEVNDSLGHKAGDQLLIEFAEILKDSVRDSDVVGRIGGDEFVIVLPHTDRDGAEAIGIRIIELVNQHFKGRGKVLSRVSVSIGVSLFSDARAQGVNPFILADQLLYDAKHAGRSRVAVRRAENTIVRSAKPAFSVEELPEILESHSIRLELQPILELETGRVDAAEGLLRINLDGTDVPPGQFIQSVEQAGLAPKLDIAVMREGIKHIERLRAVCPTFSLALNLSGYSLSSAKMREELRAEFRAHDLPRESIRFEITETAPIEDIDAAKEFMQMLKDFGFHIAIDDFGAGHEPYQYLKKFDFSVLKIAGEFIEGMVTNRVDRSIVESIAQLAKDEEMETVAEFVSSKEILEAVREIGVTYAQGFYIGKSKPIDEFIATYLETNQTATWG
ncbi:hypothetical protein J433_05625 [Corynebacterium glutamicum MT]|uniref:EAL domain-containing protein n=1 Tax=Corynebacterium glutamicum TaxID=1718 RepID=UPI0002230CFC|nr:EAL domain-containing protein [Corynebacterium glutamicum]AGN18776.1 hypothetical protein C624_05975 [Corynebacterium glutamicum SCgG1]AGN21799.1 hypothetical protein C629_05975 [Corynebacterium glutamicum SCgG2]EGV40130.1 hypothetical protein CgS9114_09963 [Corynebacterium glutamicum S9114]EOA65093.1 hypothetical protein J433_05625 [Corynebacterium glutamicum MT]EPP41128.1 hypothetical protein A583_05492 [Corynebacterium glutamicum Z188]